MNRLLPARSCLITLAVLLSSATNILADTLPADRGTIEITPLIHSSVQLEYRSQVIQIDPWGVRGLPNAKRADLILITDNPGHHLDVDAIERLSKPNATVIIPANSLEDLPYGVVLNNGGMIRASGLTVEAIAAYDIIPGAPEHPKGDANGYVFELGGKRFFFAGVTECVDEVKALQGIDVAFLPMNIPIGRMRPGATAECAKIINPDVVYLYHYDQNYARRAVRPDYPTTILDSGLTVEQSLDLFEELMADSGIEIRRGDFYPPLN
ncbi:MAG: MBL fold metallo-hydrolase [Gammaproteobacteria bacterium]|nr:MBL fold metallo-hydrolase [Gammaproteobacteria bacterium]